MPREHLTQVDKGLVKVGHVSGLKVNSILNFIQLTLVFILRLGPNIPMVD